jgi:hypothetical protein
VRGEADFEPQRGGIGQPRATPGVNALKKMSGALKGRINGAAWFWDAPSGLNACFWTTTPGAARGYLISPLRG